MADLFENPIGLDGFGEGNFKALFDSIERDQVARGVIDTTA